VTVRGAGGQARREHEEEVNRLKDQYLDLDERWKAKVGPA
jgi:hypothetical protein